MWVRLGIGSERCGHGVRLGFASDQEHDRSRQRQSFQRHRHPRHERLEAGLFDANHQPRALRQRLLIGEQRSDVGIWPEAEQKQVEARRAGIQQLPLIFVRSRRRTELPSHAVDGQPYVTEPFEQGLVSQLEVREIIVGRYAALVAEPQRRACPRVPAVGRPLVGIARGAAPGEDDVAAGLRG